MTPHEVTV